MAWDVLSRDVLSYIPLKECTIFKTILEHSFALPPSDTM